MSPYGRPSSADPDLLPRRLRPTRCNSQTPFSDPSRPQRKRPLTMVTERSLSVLCPRDIGGGTLEKHMTCGLVGILLNVSDQLNDCSLHEVTLIDSISVTDEFF